MNNFSKNDDKIFLSRWIINLLEITKTCLKLYSKTKNDFYYDKAKYFSKVAKDFKNDLETIK